MVHITVHYRMMMKFQTGTRSKWYPQHGNIGSQVTQSGSGTMAETAYYGITVIGPYNGGYWLVSDNGDERYIGSHYPTEKEIAYCAEQWRS
jgi:hypothetical protein